MFSFDILPCDFKFYITKCGDFPYGYIGTFVFLISLYKYKYSFKSFNSVLKTFALHVPATGNLMYALITAV